MSGSMRSGAGRTAAARSRSAGMQAAGPRRGLSLPGAWRTVTGPSSSARPAKALTSARNLGTSVLDRSRSRHHQMAGTHGGLRCDEVALLRPSPRVSSRLGEAGRQQQCCVPPSMGTRSILPRRALIPAGQRAVFHGCLSYAAELGLLEANPLEHVTWRRAIAGQRRAWVHRPVPSRGITGPWPAAAAHGRFAPVTIKRSGQRPMPLAQHRPG